MAALIRAKVEAGEYASESEVIRDGLRVLIARDRAVEKWLREEAVIPGEAEHAGKPKTRQSDSGSAVSRTRTRKAAAAPEAAPAPSPALAEHAVQPRTHHETPNFEFGRMQVVLKDAPG